MTYEETIDYMFSQLPMYQRVGKAAYKADLENHTKITGQFTWQEQTEKEQFLILLLQFCTKQDTM